MQWHGHHSLLGVESKGEMKRARLTKPKMFTASDHPAMSIHSRFRVLLGSFGKKELAFSKGTEGYSTSWVGAFPQHRVISSLLFKTTWPETVDWIMHAGDRSLS
jgi:hypothetical protein